MFSKDFEIYYYSDKPLHAVARHTHDYYEFYFFLEGSVRLHVENIAYDIKPGDFLLIPPGISHYPEFLDETTPYRRFVLWVSTEYANKLMEVSLDYGFLFQHVITSKEYLYSNDVVSFNALQSKLFTIIDEVKGSRFGREAKISLEINDLILTLNRMIYEERMVASRQVKVRLSSGISEFVDTHLEEDLSLERLSQEFFVSKYHISHAFSEDMGISLHKYIQMKRLEACKKAIASGASITSTYLLYGFSDYSAFYRAFKKTYGVAPSDATQTNEY